MYNNRYHWNKGFSNNRHKKKRIKNQEIYYIIINKRRMNQ